MFSIYKIIIISISLFISSAAVADVCTYKQAQTKLVEFNNMMQVFNREFIALMEESGDSTPELEQKRTAMAEESAAVGILLSDEFEKNKSLQYTDLVNAEICLQYDVLMKKFAPEGYQAPAVEVEPASIGDNCSTEKLWERFGVAIQKQQELGDEITKAELPAYMKLQTEIGEYATTDLAQACVKLAEFEDKLNAEL